MLSQQLITSLANLGVVVLKKKILASAEKLQILLAVVVLGVGVLHVHVDVLSDEN